MSERSQSSRVSDIIDQLTTVRYLNEAVFMAAADSSITSDATNALQSLCDVIDDRLVKIDQQLDRIMEDLR